MTFLSCFMEGFQCSIEDMPCYDASFFTEALSPAATPSPTPDQFAGELLTASPTTGSSYEDRGVEMTASPTPSAAVGALTIPAALAAACAEEAAACDADEVCQQGCFSGNLEVRAHFFCGGGGVLLFAEIFCSAFPTSAWA